MFQLLIVLTFCAGFAYGWPAGRREIFPYRQLSAISAFARRALPAASVEPDVPGRWRARRVDGPGRGLSERQRREASELMALGYLNGSRPAPPVSGVTIQESAATPNGLNLIVSGHGPVALLTDMQGSVLHTWSYDFWDVWPDADVPASGRYAQYWRRAAVLENGDLLAVYGWLGLIKLDKDSNLLWAYPGACHHDLDVADDGSIFVLEQEALVVPRIHASAPVLVDFIAVLSPDGELLRRVPILEAFERSPYAPLLQRMKRKGDLFHTNTIEVLDGSLEAASPAFRRGNVLICVRNIETIAVVDMETETVVWALTGRWNRQHQPTVLDNGRMLIFNNEAGDGVSEVIEFDPFTQDVHWSYRGGVDGPFYTETCGSNQRLPSGNTLITESDNGRAFEVTPDKTIVWEFVSPYRAGDDGELIATLLEIVRLPPDFPLGWLGGQG